MQKRDSYEKDRIPSIGIWGALQRNPFLSRLANLLNPPDPVFITRKNRLRIPKLLENLGYEKKSLKHLTVCKIKACGASCGGNAMGCG